MLRPFYILIACFLLQGGYSAQINCNGGLIYWIKGALPFIKVLDPSQPLSLTNPSSSPIPTPTPGFAFDLALMPNINGGNFSPTFYSVLANTNTFTYWNGTGWINTGHAASSNSGQVMGLGGCNGYIYSVELPSSLTPTIATIYRYSGTGSAMPILTLTPAYASPWYNFDIITDCHCNFYTLLTGTFDKYNPNGQLLSSTMVSGPNIGSYCMATVGNTIYTAGYNGNPMWANLFSSPMIFNTMPSNGPFLSNPDGFATCPIDLTSPSDAVISSNTLGCQPLTASLSVSSTLSSLSYTWSGPGLVAPPNASLVSVNAPGLYTCVISQGSCEYNRVTLYTTVLSNTSLVVPVISPTTNLCIGPNQQLFSSLSSSLYANQWSGASILSGGNSATVSIGSHGIYTLTTTNTSNGCSGGATASLLPVPVMSLSLSSNTMCVYSTLSKNIITLNVSGAPLYTLTASPGFSIPAQPAQPVVLYLSPPYPKGGAIGSATLSGSNGVCTGSASAGFSVLPVTTISLTLPDTLLCAGKSLKISARGAISYTWKPTQNISLNSDSSVIALVNGPTIYTVSGTDAYGCNSDEKTLALSVHPLHTGTLSNNILSYCVPFTADFKFSPSPAAGNVLYSEWAVNNGQFTNRKFSQLFKEAGTYTLHIKLRDSLYNCSNTLDFFVEAFPKPAANFNYTPSEPDELNNTVVFSPQGQNLSSLSFEWSFINNTNLKSGETRPSYVFDKAGIYPVALVVTNSKGCSDTLVKAIEVKEDVTFYIPNAFSPNGDGKNDLFLPVAQGIDLYRMKIFNRWGQQIFETNQLSQPWDGTFRGEACKEDLYIWKAELRTNKGKSKHLDGSVMLLR